MNFSSGNWPPAFRTVYAPACFALSALLKVLLPRLHISGRGNLPRRGGMILAPNHLSNADPLLVGYAAHRPLCYMAKRELFDIPVLGRAMRFAHAFPVERDSPDRAALRMAAEALEEGRPLVIFPEGRCAPDGRLQPLQPGVALLALKCRVPVIPVVLTNSQQFIPYGETLPRPTLARISVHFCPPLAVDDLYQLPSRQARSIFNERLETAMSNKQ